MERVSTTTPTHFTLKGDLRQKDGTIESTLLAPTTLTTRAHATPHTCLRSVRRLHPLQIGIS
eukprot:1179303-Prorocentrum_minimum.AAC.1